MLLLWQQPIFKVILSWPRHGKKIYPPKRRIEEIDELWIIMAQLIEDDDEEEDEEDED